ncbi:MAG: iron-containing alcohol dehydrogenase [Bacteroides sp.]|nr:iron-containing alcohol dehydrogenase [Prevotella sp.]MCM1407390.1 iron-containing alcohol dehydrogenase [Treponema brennaborense]MCM1469880.1 iron-containing alcohol dehydrogenase [Bacteroides sp.]
MNNFEYYTPTKIVFGKGAENETARLVKEQDCKKVLVHYGGGSVKKSGLLDKILSLLGEEQIEYTALGGVMPNPRLSLVRKGIELGRQESVDFILAVGGGSVIDSAKAIAYGLANSCDVWDIYLKKAVPVSCLPIGAVLTIAAAGSEMSNSSVITNEEGYLKRGYNSDLCRCRFAVMNPEITMTLPDYQTSCGCTDIIMHTLERYFAPGREQAALTDALAEGLIKTVIKNAAVLRQDPHNYNARSEIMWAGSLSHNGLTGCGGQGDFATHQLEHELSGMFDVTHGAGLAAIWGSWARYVCPRNPQRFAAFAERVMGIVPSGTHPDAESTAMEGIKAMESFFVSIGMPVSIGALGIDLSEAQIEELAEKCSFNGTRTIGSFPPLNKADMAAIYRLAR